jgi:hypothetical protein
MRSWINKLWEAIASLFRSLVDQSAMEQIVRERLRQGPTSGEALRNLLASKGHVLSIPAFYEFMSCCEHRGFVTHYHVTQEIYDCRVKLRHYRDRPTTIDDN